MSDLPNPQQGNQLIHTNPPAGGPIRPIEVSSIGGREKEAGGITSGELPLTPVGGEMEVPKEVASFGVSAQPTSIPIPPNVSQMGVKPLGQNIPSTPSIGTITLPLTDDQIFLGTKQNIFSSWRWLAEWCKRRLRQIRLLKK